MKPLPIRTIEQPVTYVVDYDLNLVLSNIANITLCGNAYPTESLADIDSTGTGKLPAVMPTASIWRKLSSLVSEDFKTVQAMRNYFMAMEQSIADWQLALNRPKQIDSDYAACTARRLQSWADWQKTWAETYASGHVLPLYKFGNLGPPGLLAKGAPDFVFGLPSAKSPFMGRVGRTALALDLPAFGPDLMPMRDSAGRLDSKSVPLGLVGHAREQAKIVQGFFIRYLLCQPWLMHLALTESHFQFRCDLTERLLPKYTDKINKTRARRKDLRAALGALHPLVQAVQSLVTGATAHGHFGKHELLPWPTHFGHFGTTSTERECEVLTGELVESTMRAVTIEDSFDVDACSGMPWGSLWEGQDEGDTHRMFTYAEILGALAAIKSELTLGDGALTTIGWRSVSLPPVELRLDAAEFTLTDGERYSKPLSAAIMGLSPVLSLGSGLHEVFSVRITDFNNLPAGNADGSALELRGITLSTISVNCPGGHYSKGLRIEREIMPASMMMGAMDYMPLRLDPLDRDTRVAEYFSYWGGLLTPTPDGRPAPIDKLESVLDLPGYPGVMPPANLPLDAASPVRLTHWLPEVQASFFKNGSDRNAAEVASAWYAATAAAAPTLRQTLWVYKANASGEIQLLPRRQILFCKPVLSYTVIEESGLVAKTNKLVASAVLLDGEVSLPSTGSEVDSLLAIGQRRAPRVEVAAL